MTFDFFSGDIPVSKPVLKNEVMIDMITFAYLTIAAQKSSGLSLSNHDSVVYHEEKRINLSANSQHRDMFELEIKPKVVVENTIFGLERVNDYFQEVNDYFSACDINVNM